MTENHQHKQTKIYMREFNKISVCLCVCVSVFHVIFFIARKEDTYLTMYSKQFIMESKIWFKTTIYLFT